MTVSDNSRTTLQPQTGVTLVEVLVVLLIISVGMVATAKFQADLLHEGGTNKARIQALGRSVEKLENLRINHATAAGGGENITGINAEYALVWTVGGFAGITDAQRHTTTITWTDSKNRSQNFILGGVLYPDNLYTNPSGAAGCLIGDCSEPPPPPPPPPPNVDIELGDPEVLVIDENWPGITDPAEDLTGPSGTPGDDKIYKSGHISSPFDLGDGDDILYINGQIKSELYAGGGDDQIETTGNVKSKIYLEEGDDAFKTHGHLQDEIDGGSGNDVIIIGKHLQSKALLGSGNDKLTIGQHVQDEVYADSGHDYVFVGGQVKNKIHMDSGDDFVVITGSISDPIYGGSGNDSLCLLGYSSSNWNGVDQSSFENIKTSDGVIVKGSGDNFGTGCDYSSSWIGGSSGDYLYSYPVSLTITPQGGLDQVAMITLVNEIPDTEIEADSPDVIDNGDGTFTVLVSNDKAVFNLFTNELFDVSDLTTEETNEWVDNEQSVTVTLKEQP